MTVIPKWNRTARREPDTASRRVSAWAELSKRAFDLVVGGAVLVVVSPVLAVVALLVLLFHGRPILFRQERVGRHGEPFTMLKFRSMVVNNDDSALREMNTRELTQGGGPGTSDGVYKLESDPRITPLGAVLRRYSLDELPQLFNVMRGDMSIVGPRPSLQWEVDLFEPRFLRRHEVRPGLTGLWQVSGRNELSMREMLALDVEYVDTWSLRGDIALLLRTPKAVFSDGVR
ncbi:MAG: sugar transferase [Dehalococcoidia bacterium]